MPKFRNFPRSMSTNRAAPSLPEIQYFMCCTKVSRKGLARATQFSCFLLSLLIVSAGAIIMTQNMLVLPQSQELLFINVEQAYNDAKSNDTLTASVVSEYFQMAVQPKNHSSITLWNINEMYFDVTNSAGVTWTQPLRSRYALCFRANLLIQVIEGSVLAMCSLAFTSALFACFGFFIPHLTGYPLVLSLFGTLVSSVLAMTMDTIYYTTSLCGNTPLSQEGWTYSVGCIALIASVAISAIAFGFACTIDIRYVKTPS